MKPKPTPAKLPKAGLRYARPYGSAVLFAKKGKLWSVPAAVIPCRTLDEARAICKAAPFLRLSEEEKVERLAAAICMDEFWPTPEYVDTCTRLAAGIHKRTRARYRDMALAVLSAMNMGGASK